MKTVTVQEFAGRFCVREETHERLTPAEANQVFSRERRAFAARFPIYRQLFPQRGCDFQREGFETPNKRHRVVIVTATPQPVAA